MARSDVSVRCMRGLEWPSRHLACAREPGGPAGMLGTAGGGFSGSECLTCVQKRVKEPNVTKDETELTRPASGLVIHGAQNSTRFAKKMKRIKSCFSCIYPDVDFSHI